MDFRREGRELALKLLYREELTGLTDLSIPDIEDVGERAIGFAQMLISGVRSNIPEINAAISAASEHWDIARMGTVDKAVLRIGVFELLQRPDTSVAVVINEAVELARRYSSEECGRFVNGILDRIATERR
ncbi:MAG: transcription antitermination factor NusB [Candidatus Eisenbacteria bacterium]|nr:transcription antitermination factor NusB [Candidatus Eisenbacteria bacterium]